MEIKWKSKETCDNRKEPDKRDLSQAKEPCNKSTVMIANQMEIKKNLGESKRALQKRPASIQRALQENSWCDCESNANQVEIKRDLPKSKDALQKRPVSVIRTLQQELQLKWNQIQMKRDLETAKGALQTRPISVIRALQKRPITVIRAQQQSHDCESNGIKWRPHGIQKKSTFFTFACNSPATECK